MKKLDAEIAKHFLEVGKPVYWTKEDEMAIQVKAHIVRHELDANSLDNYSLTNAIMKAGHHIHASFRTIDNSFSNYIEFSKEELVSIVNGNKRK